jgi:hypothetical protein
VVPGPAPRQTAAGGRVRVKVKQLPCPRVLSAVSSPPMSRMNWLLKARPRPVPPCLSRPVAVWLKGWKSRAISDRSIPGPVSLTLNWIASAPRGTAWSVTRPAVVNLTALPTRLMRTWRSFISSPTTPAGQGGGGEDQVEAPVAGPLPERGLGLRQEPGGIEGGEPQGHAPGLDFGHIQDVVDEGQEVITAALDGGQALALGVFQLGIAGQDLGEAQDGVHGGADFVAHAGQEFALGAGWRPPPWPAPRAWPRWPGELPVKSKNWSNRCGSPLSRVGRIRQSAQTSRPKVLRAWISRRTCWPSARAFRQSSSTPVLLTVPRVRKS